MKSDDKKIENNLKKTIIYVILYKVIMAKKLRIPSIFLRIVSGPYKGYNAEYRQRIRQGEFLYVVIAATGQFTTVPIEIVVFILEDGSLKRYVHRQKGLSLIKIGQEESGEIINIPEASHNPTEMVFNADAEDVVDDNLQVHGTSDDAYERIKSIVQDDGEDEEMDEEYLNEDEIEEQSEQYMNAFNQFQQVAREHVELDNHPVTALLQQLFNLSGFNLDTVTINNHSTILKDALKGPSFENISFTTELYKTFVMAYVFIYVNNMNMGYPVVIKDCVPSANDDPVYIICIALKSGFITTNNPDSLTIDNQIKLLTKVMNTKIIPSRGEINMTKRFASMKISGQGKSSIKPLIERKTTNFQRFPIFSRGQSEVKVKEMIIGKVKNKIKTYDLNSDTTSILRSFVDNFDAYIKGPLFAKLNYNPDLKESKVLIPFIREYKKRLDFEEDKFYEKPSLSTITNSIPDNKDLIEVKKTIINNINSRIISNINSGNTSDIERDALEYVLNNHMDIISYKFNDIRDMKLSLDTAGKRDREIINSILMYRKMYFDLIRKFKNKSFM